MCESSGLILQLFIYSGLQYPDIHDLGQTGAIVLKLMEDFFGKVYTDFADNYYNSIKLLKFMSEKQTYIYSTLQSDRKGNPKEVVSEKLKLNGNAVKLLEFHNGNTKKTFSLFPTSTNSSLSQSKTKEMK